MSTIPTGAPEIEVTEVHRKLVRDILGEWSEGYPNLSWADLREALARAFAERDHAAELRAREMLALLREACLPSDQFVWGDWRIRIATLLARIDSQGQV